MSVENAAIEQELQLRRVKEEAAIRDTATVRKIAKVVLILGWAAGLIPIVGLFGLFVSFWAGVGTGVYLLIAGARKTGLQFILAGFFGTLAVGIASALLWLAIGVGGSAMM